MKGRAAVQATLKTRRARAAIAAVVVGAGVVVGTTAAQASDTLIKIPAPPGAASGAAATVGDLVSIGQTDATATQNGASAGSVSVSLGGHTIIGGSQSGPGQNTGALLDTGATPLGRVQVAPFAASVTQTDSRRQADAASAAARADVIDPDVVHVDVLQSASSATHTGQLSSGRAVSDGVVVRVGGPSGTTIRILHSEANSNGTGKTYLLAIGDNAVIDGDILAPVCALDLGPVLELACMTVSGGVGGLTATDLNAVVAGLTATASTASASNGLGTTIGGGEGTRVLASSAPAPQVAANGLARTGHDLWFLMFVAEALIALGLATLATVKVSGNVLRVRTTH
jgi:hypothetical protein